MSTTCGRGEGQILKHYTAFALCMISLEGLFRTVTHISHYQWNRTGLAQDICLNKISS